MESSPLDKLIVEDERGVVVLSEGLFEDVPRIVLGFPDELVLNVAIPSSGVLITWCRRHRIIRKVEKRRRMS